MNVHVPKDIVLWKKIVLVGFLNTIEIKKRIKRIKNKFIEDSFCSKFIIYKKRYTAFFFNFKWLSEAESGLNFLIFSDHQKASLGA